MPDLFSGARWCAVVLCLFPLALIADSSPSYEMRVDKSVMIPMRDGVELSTDLYMPEGLDTDLPTILIRTVYGKNQVFDWGDINRRLVERGYVVAVQDIRGRYESEGRWHVATGRRNDSDDTIDWIVDQEWSSGKVGTRGCSYQGEVQLVSAATRHPNLVTIVPMSPASGYYAPGRAWTTFDGGVFELAQIAGWFAGSGTQVFYQPPEWLDRGEWFRSEAARKFSQGPEIDWEAYLPFLRTLPTATILQRAGLPPTEYEKFINSLPDSEYFRSMDFATDRDRFNVPALFMDSWYDYGPAETLRMFQVFQDTAESEAARNNQFIIIGPGTHCNFPSSPEATVVGERELGDASLDVYDLQIRWFDYWLKGDASAFSDIPKIQYYVMGKNEWRHANTWPPAGMSEERWYLAAPGNANSRLGDGVLLRGEPAAKGEDEFEYDPASPVPSLGGHTCCTGMPTEAGGYDQSETELREDILVYTSEPLAEGIEVTGALRVVLTVSSNAVDTDFTAKLVDVYPDGRAFNIQEGALRMRFREGLDREVFMSPGERYQIELDLHATSNYFPAGHRIRLEVSSSNFPRWERNMNTGGDTSNESKWVVAKNTVYHGVGQASYIVLPVIRN